MKFYRRSLYDGALLKGARFDSFSHIAEGSSRRPVTAIGPKPLLRWHRLWPPRFRAPASGSRPPGLRAGLGAPWSAAARRASSIAYRVASDQRCGRRGAVEVQIQLPVISAPRPSVKVALLRSFWQHRCAAATRIRQVHLLVDDGDAAHPQVPEWMHPRPTRLAVLSRPVTVGRDRHRPPWAVPGGESRSPGGWPGDRESVASATMVIRSGAPLAFTLLSDPRENHRSIRQLLAQPHNGRMGGLFRSNATRGPGQKTRSRSRPSARPEVPSSRPRPSTRTRGRRLGVG